MYVMYVYMYVKNPSDKCFLRGLVVASSLPHTAKHIKLRYETPSIIIHTVNDSDEDDTIDNDANDILIIYFNSFKEWKRLRERQNKMHLQKNWFKQRCIPG